MKILKNLSSLFLVLIVAGCSVGVKKDLLTGLKVSNQGLGLEDAYLAVNSQKATSSEFPLNEVVDLVITGVDGYKEKEGRVYLGASMVLTDSKQDTVVNYPDLFAAYDSAGILPVDVKQVTLSLTIGSPMVQGEKYLWKSRVWDKNGKGEIVAETEITIK
jgi:hypothetical protein